MTMILELREPGRGWEIIASCSIEPGGPDLARRRLIAMRDRWAQSGFIPSNSEYRLTMGITPWSSCKT